MRACPALCSLAFLPILLTSSVQSQSSTSPYDSVDPLIGTADGGNTFPGATLPFGMVQWSPDTNTDAWYKYNEKQLYGFSLTHISGAGCPVYGDFAVLPVMDEMPESATPAPVPFDRKEEKAQPGLYAVTLNNGVRVEVTAAERAGIAHFTFPQGAKMRVLINAGSSANSIADAKDDPKIRESFGSHIEYKPDGSFSGWTSAGRFCGSDSGYKLYVSGKFDRRFELSGVWGDESRLKAPTGATGKHTGLWVSFGGSNEVVVKVGISFVSVEGARKNLQKEIPDFNFAAVAGKAKKTWSELLERVAVDGGTPEQRKIFYTGVYHSFLSPNIFSDEDGQYVRFDGKVHSLASTQQKTQYANFSDWDIYRNTVQWQALFEPEREGDMMQSLVNDAEQSGWLPRWPAANDVTYVMGGDSPDAVLSSAYAFGARSFDTKRALDFMVKGGSEPGMGPHGVAERPFLTEYLKAGYAPVDTDHIAASRTLEYASDDFTIAQFAKAVGREDEYHRFLKQSENWKALVDPETHWIRPRNADGSWMAGFDTETSMPKRYEGAGAGGDQMGFEEGNTWQYSFMVPFDYPALFEAMGGEQVVDQRLDRFFTALRCWGKPCFNIENEPDFVTPYAYVFLGKPWKTQEVVTRIGKETFKAAPDGVPGNDDLGATSGVYVWNALGFYPAVPGVGGLVIGTPMFDKATLKFAGGRTLAVSREGAGIYVQQVMLNGAPYSSSWLPLSKIRTGTNELEFKMSTEPNMQRGAALEDRPPNFR
jgi:predicted alpha-1,2-mannosidase